MSELYCNKEKRRLSELDFIKGIAIMMVVVGHTNCPSSVAHIISLVHMPLFFMASGYLSYGRKINSLTDLSFYIRRKIITLYFPFVISSILIFSVIYICGLDEIEICSFRRQIGRFFLFSTGISVPLCIQHLWFLKTLFFVYLIYSFLLFFGDYKSIIYAAIASLPFLFILLPSPFFVSVLWPLRGFFYFSLGYYIRKTALSINSQHLPFLLLIWMFLGLFWIDIPVDMRSSIGFVSISMALGSACAFLFLLKIGRLLANCLFVKFLCFCGRKSLYIYLLHFPIFYLFTKVFTDIELDACVSDKIHWSIYFLLVLFSTLGWYQLSVIWHSSRRVSF